MYYVIIKFQEIVKQNSVQRPICLSRRKKKIYTDIMDTTTTSIVSRMSYVWENGGVCQGTERLPSFKTKKKKQLTISTSTKEDYFSRDISGIIIGFFAKTNTRTMPEFGHVFFESVFTPDRSSFIDTPLQGYYTATREVFGSICVHLSPHPVVYVVSNDINNPIGLFHLLRGVCQSSFFFYKQCQQ